MKTCSIPLLIFLIFLVRINHSFAQPTPIQEIKGVLVKTLHSEILNEDRELYIYIPENSNKTKLPVIYILDGHSPFIFQEAIKYTKTKPHILVGISTKKNRNRDTIPVKISQKKNSGGSKKFLRFLVEELQPYINANSPSSDENVLFGASNSGLFTIYAMLENPDGFQAYLASSPMIGHCKDYMVEKLNSFSKPEKLKGKFLYIMGYEGLL